MMKLKFLVFFGIFSLLLFACLNEPDSLAAPPLASRVEDSTASPAENKRRPDLICSAEQGPFCWQNRACIDFCEKLFRSDEDRQKCKNQSLTMGIAFENLWKILQTGVFQHIQAEVLSCFLDLTDNKRLFFKGFSEDEAKEFLLEMTEDIDLMEAVSKKGSFNFSVLDALFRKIDNKIVNAIAEPLTFGSDDNFLISASDNRNSLALVYLDDYIIYKCGRDSNCSEPLDYYCKILKNVKLSTWLRFFEPRHNFRSNYRSDIESRACNGSHCKYGDFEDWQTLCRSL